MIIGKIEEGCPLCGAGKEKIKTITFGFTISSAKYAQCTACGCEARLSEWNKARKKPDNTEAPVEFVSCRETTREKH